MIKIFLFVLIYSSLFSSFANASNWWVNRLCGEYPQTVSKIENRTIDSITGVCQLVPLKLIRVQKNSNSVDAWSGGYERDVVMTTTYRIDHYDWCSGNWLWAEEQKGTTNEAVPFNIENPNLSSNTSESYVSNAPLTDQEAQAELPKALVQCQSLHIGKWP